MRRGLELQVPSILQSMQNLKNGPLIQASTLTRIRTRTISPHSLTYSSIRHGSSLSIMSANSRQFSTSSPFQAIVRIPIRSRRISKSLNTTQSNETEEATQLPNFITSKAFLLIHKEEYEKILPFLIDHKSEFTSEELKDILQELEYRQQLSTILSIHMKFPGKSFDSPQIVKLLLRVSFKAEDYSLVEIIFSRYLELPDLQPKYCNMGLRAVILNGNQEFAKQLLYQMVYSHLPMNHSTLKVFLSAVQRSGTFQSVKFAVDLIDKNPNIPVDEETLSTLMKCYAQNAKEDEMERFSKMLEDRGCDLYELDLYKFYESLLLKVEINYEELWVALEEIRTKISNPRMLRNFYVEMLSVFSQKLRREDMFKLVGYFSEDKIEFSSEINSILFSFFSKTGDIEGLLTYFNSFKDKKIHIQPIFIHTLWKALINHEPEVAEKMTNDIQEFLTKNYSSAQLKNNFLKTINLKKATRKSLPRFLPENPDRKLSKGLKIVNELLKEKKDQQIIALVNDELRQGLKPKFALLITALVGLIKIRSPQSIVLYRLGSQLHNDKMIDFDLVWLRKTLDDLKSERNQIRVRQAGGGLIRDFRLNHNHKMSHSHYNDLANLAIDVSDYELALELLNESRSINVEVEKRDNLKIYVTLLKALTRMKDKENYLQVMSLLLTEEGLRLTSFCMKRLKTNKQFFVKRTSHDEDYKDFTEKFDAKYELIRQRYDAQQKGAVSGYKKAIDFLEDWNKTT